MGVFPLRQPWEIHGWKKQFRAQVETLRRPDWTGRISHPLYPTGPSPHLWGTLPVGVSNASLVKEEAKGGIQLQREEQTMRGWWFWVSTAVLVIGLLVAGWLVLGAMANIIMGRS